MDYAIIVENIIDLGFPIVMCLLLYHSNNNIISELKDVVSANTEAISKVLDKMGDK